MNAQDAFTRPFVSPDGNETAVRREPFEALGEWSEFLGREIEEQDFVDVLDATLARLPWAKAAVHQIGTHEHRSDL